MHDTQSNCLKIHEKKQHTFRVDDMMINVFFQPHNLHIICVETQLITIQVRNEKETGKFTSRITVFSSFGVFFFCFCCFVCAPTSFSVEEETNTKKIMQKKEEYTQRINTETRETRKFFRFGSLSSN